MEFLPGTRFPGGKIGIYDIGIYIKTDSVIILFFTFFNLYYEIRFSGPGGQMIPQPTAPSYNIPNSHPSTSPVYSSASLDGSGYNRPPQSARVHPPTNPYSMHSQLPRVPDRC